jgi:hypothetical protein
MDFGENNAPKDTEFRRVGFFIEIEIALQYQQTCPTAV